MEFIRTLKPIWELLSTLLNWGILAVILLFICIAGTIILKHYFIDGESDDIEKKIVCKKRIKTIGALFLSIFAIMIIIRIVLQFFLKL